MGRALTPAVLELARWGARFLGEPQPGDHHEPDWARLGLVTFAKRGPSPPRSFGISLRDGDREICFHVAGGPEGTRLRDESAPADVALRVGASVTLFALASGALAAQDAIESGELEAEGDLDALDDFPALFDLSQPPTDRGV